MRKIIALVLAGMMLVGFTHPIYATENEIVIEDVTQDVQMLAITPKLKIPHIVIPKITPKFNFTIDFSKYIPRLF